VRGGRKGSRLAPGQVHTSLSRPGTRRADSARTQVTRKDAKEREHADVPHPGCVCGGGAVRCPADRRRGYRGRRVRRVRRGRPVPHADPGHELGPVHPALRWLHRGHLPGPRGLRVLLQRRRRRLRGADRRLRRGRLGAGRRRDRPGTAGRCAAAGGARRVPGRRPARCRRGVGGDRRRTRRGPAGGPVPVPGAPGRRGGGDLRRLHPQERQGVSGQPLLRVEAS
jgi:hypothetical protein